MSSPVISGMGSIGRTSPPYWIRAAYHKCSLQNLKTAIGYLESSTYYWRLSLDRTANYENIYKKVLKQELNANKGKT